METNNPVLAAIITWLLTVLPSVIAAIVIFLVMFYLAGWVGKWIRRACERRKLDAEATLLLSRLGQYGTITLGIVWALEQVNFDLTAFLAGLGIVGFTIGFALQDISRNFVAGVLLLWQQPFDLGDSIKVKDYTGSVTDISLRATEIRTADGLLVLIPNADVYTNPLTNYTKVPRRRLAMKVAAAYTADLDRVTAVALDAVSQATGLALAEPVPSVTFESLADESVAFTLHYWIDTATTKPSAAQDVGVKAVKSAFEAAGIPLTAPVTPVAV